MNTHDHSIRCVHSVLIYASYVKSEFPDYKYLIYVHIFFRLAYYYINNIRLDKTERAERITFQLSMKICKINGRNKMESKTSRAALITW